MEYVKRDLEDSLKKYLTLPQILAIVGPRRSGKTTLLKHLQSQFLDSLYLSFEDQKILYLFQWDIDNFAELYVKKHPLLFIDEFHYASEGGKQLKYLFDFFPDKKIIISGSSSLDLMVKAVKYLVGRIVSFQLLPFSFREFLRARSPDLLTIAERGDLKGDSPLHDTLRKLWEEYVRFGGYPEVVLQPDPEIKKKLLEGIYNTYLLREIRDIAGLSDDFKFVRLLQALALQIGNMISFNELAIISGYDYRTLKSRLNLLQKTFVIDLLSPFFRNKQTEIVKNPKVYFFDTGLRNLIIDNFQRMELRPDQGAICENFVYNMLQREEMRCYFWRTKNRQEIDFIIEEEEKIIPIEVKSSAVQQKIPRAFYSFRQKYKFEKGYLLSLSSEREIVSLNGSQIEKCPLYLFNLGGTLI